jgi:hypothetical protein
MTDKERIKVLTDVILNMAQFMRNNPPGYTSDDDSMTMQEFCNCYVDGASDPTGQRILAHFVEKSYNKFMENS